MFKITVATPAKVILLIFLFLLTIYLITKLFILNQQIDIYLGMLQ